MVITPLFLLLGLQIAACSGFSHNSKLSTGRQHPRIFIQPITYLQPHFRNFLFSWNNRHISLSTTYKPSICISQNDEKHRIITSFYFSSLNSSMENDNDASTTEPIEWGKKHLSQGYRVAQYGFTAASIGMFAIPDHTLTTLLATKWGGAAGFAIAARLCYILRNANNENRLQSDTYKRLNLGLLGFGVIGLFAIPGEAAFLSSKVATSIVAGILTIFRFFLSIVAFLGWSSSFGTTTTANIMRVNTLREVMNELGRGMRTTIKGLKVESAKKALTYRNCLLIVCFGIVSSFMEGLFNIRYQNEFTRSLFEITLQWSAISRLFMIATMIYSLKDAAERDRLTGSTFIELNLMIGAWASLVGLGQAIYPLGFAAYRGVEMFAFAIPFLLKAYKSYKEKRT